MCEDLCTNENIILMTLGFDFTVDHARTHVIQACKLVRGWTHNICKKLQFKSYLF